MRTTRKSGSRVLGGGSLFAVLAGSVILTSSCAYIGAGAALALSGSGGDGGGGGGAPAVEPVAILGAVGPRVIGAVQIDYQLQDANDDLVDIAVEFSSDEGSSFAPATVTGADAGVPSGNVITDVPATGTLTVHSFDWDPVADLGTAAVTTVQIRIVPTDAKGLAGLESVSGTFTTGNDAPEVEVGALSASTGIVPVVLTAYDSTRDDCDLSVEQSFSTDGGASFTAWSAATILFPSPLGVASEPRPSGVTHTFAWDSMTDVGTLNALARLQVTVDDTYDLGTSVTSNDFDVSNNDAPAGFINDPGRQDGIVQVDFILVDPQQDLVDVVFDFTLDTADPPDPLSFESATIRTGATTGLASDGRTHSVFWDSGADLGQGAVPNVRLRITPSDVGGQGTPFLTDFFVVGNEPPSVSVRNMTGETHEGFVTLDFALIDTTGDFCDITVEYSTNGTDFFPATVAVGGQVDLPSASGGGVGHTISWASLQDLGLTNEPAVEVQITPCDDPTGTNRECGAAGSTMPFTLNNSEAPAAYIAFPLAGDVVGGAASITYLLFQADSQSLDITMEFSTDGGTGWAVATEGAGSDGTTGLNSSPGGTSHIFVWETTVDLPATQDFPDVLLRLAPDLGGSGVPHVTASFVVDNNGAPEITLGTPPSPQTLGDVDLDYTIYDGESDRADITVEASTDGGVTFSPATDAGAGAGSDGTTALTSTPAGVSHRFVWDSVADLVAMDLVEPDVLVRVTPNDNPAYPPLGRGIVGRTIYFSVDNTSPPQASALLPQANAGSIRFDFTLSDDESDTAFVAVEFSSDGGTSYAPASILPPASAPITGSEMTGVGTSPGGVPHFFTWDSDVDIGRTNLSGPVRVRVTPRDTKVGLGDTVALDVLNNDAPEVTVFDINGLQSGDVNLAYSLRDSFSDPIDIVVEYRTGGTGAWSIAAKSTGPLSEGTTGLTSGPIGQEAGHVFVWDAYGDLRTTRFDLVELRITPSDPFTGGMPASTNLFALDNSIGADLVLGKSDFLHGSVDGRGLDFTFWLTKCAMATDGTRVFLCDSNNHRVLILNTIPTSDFQTADVVLGQPDFSVNLENEPTTSKSTFYCPGGACFDGVSLYVSDTGNNRVLIWDGIPTAHGTPADHILGQSSPAGGSPNRGLGPAADTLFYPRGVHGNATYLFVSDTANHRCLVWTLPIDFSGGDGPAAQYVLGQAFFDVNQPNRGGTAGRGTLKEPCGLAADASTLFVADAENNRVLMWDLGVPLTDGRDADRVLGQQDFTSVTPNDDPGVDACPPEFNGAGSRTRRTMDRPYDVEVDATSVYVADCMNHRILIWNSPNPLSGSCADIVLGQADGLSAANGTSATALKFPQAVASTGAAVLILDWAANRLKIHDPLPAVDNEPAAYVFGQQDFTSDLPNHRGVDSRTVHHPSSVETDGNILFVSDRDNHRVMVWNTLPNVNFKNADFVLGQTSFQGDSPFGGGNMGFNSPGGLAFDPVADRLFVTDEGNSRVMVYDGPFSTGMTASAVIGQPDFASIAPGTDRNRLKSPRSVDWDGTYLWVADTGNHRVLAFSTILMGADADWVLGQAGFLAGGSQHSGTDPEKDQSLSWPTDCYATGSHLLVVDQANQRIMVWDLPLGLNDEVAAVVIGQPDFLAGGAAATRDHFYAPAGIDGDGTAIYVVDGGNNRVLIWDTIPVTHGTPADRIIGQPDFVSRAANNGGIGPGSLFLRRAFIIEEKPAAVSGPPVRLWIPDFWNDRVLRYDVTP